MYNIKFEEQWYDKDSLAISKEFVKEIFASKNNIVEKDHNSIKLKFVGVMAYSNEILIVLPKYLSDSSSTYQELLEHAKRLIKVFKKLPHSTLIKYKDAFFIGKEPNESTLTEISIADFLIRDYIQNGVIEKKHEIFRKGNHGKIDWGKTINLIKPFKSGRNILYLETYRKHSISNVEELITIIHNLVVDYCFAKYGELLDIKRRGQSVDKLHKRLQKLGNNEYILKLIENELQQTFAERDIRVLKALYSFFSNVSNSKKDDFKLYGSSRFHYVWEKMCSDLFANQYDAFSALIEAPRWRTTNGVDHMSEKNKLEPDIIKTHRFGTGTKIFFIFDAKYYSLVLTDEKLMGQPGSYDIVKQFVYQIALESELENYDEIYNCLVYPKVMDGIYSIVGTVQLSFFNKSPIINMYLSPDYVIDQYINNRVISEELMVSMVLDFKEVLR